MLRCACASSAACTFVTGDLVFSAGAPEGRIDVIAHRGASAYAPENTLAAFALAHDMGAHWFELDCTLSRDGEVVVIHDDTVDRTTAFRGRVGDLMYHDGMDRYDAGTWYDEKFASDGIPTLGQALDLAKDQIGVYIEIKDSDDDSQLLDGLLELAENTGSLLPGIADETLARIKASGTRNLELTRKVVAAVQQRGMGRQIVLQSFSPVVCATALLEAPGLRAEQLACSDSKKPDLWRNCLRWYEVLTTPGFNVHKDDVDESLVRRVHGDGKTIAAWTVNEEEDMWRLAELGVDAIITDRPDICAATLKDLERA